MATTTARDQVADVYEDHVLPHAHGRARQPAGLMTGIELEYDSLGRLVKETDPLGAETVLAHDDAGNRTSLTDAEDNTTVWAFDGVGRAVRETNPLDDARTFVYDDVGRAATRGADARPGSAGGVRVARVGGMDAAHGAEQRGARGLLRGGVGGGAAGVQP